MAESPKLAVILVNYNNEEDTIDCLRTLSEQTLDEFITIVVDNDSKPGSYQKLKDNYSFPVYLRNVDNLGFTGGNNSGIEYALGENAEWVLLLNNDTEIEPSFLEEFLEEAENLPTSAGVVGPKIHSYDSGDVWSAGGSINPLTGGTVHRTGDSQNIEQKNIVDYNIGASLLVRAEVFRDVGLLDDDFFIYYEETEFCQRAHQAGWEIWYVPVEGVYHKETVDYAVSPFREYYFTRNRFLFVQKTQPLHRRLVFYPYFIIRFVLLQLLYVLSIEQDLVAAKETLRGGVHAFFGKTGKQEF